LTKDKESEIIFNLNKINWKLFAMGMLIVWGIFTLYLVGYIWHTSGGHPDAFEIGFNSSTNQMMNTYYADKCGDVWLTCQSGDAQIQMMDAIENYNRITNILLMCIRYLLVTCLVAISFTLFVVYEGDKK